MTLIELNEFQTPLDKLGLENAPDEVRNEFFELINTVPFIKRLISKDRKRARDLPRDEEGKIIVDLANPHILEDMDYFRPSLLHYKKTGRYTDLRPNSNPNSQYMKWLKEEIRRCWYGYVRESDGEWVTGNMYFYLNYHLIEITDDSDKDNDNQPKNRRKGKMKGDRRVDFPDCWEGVYWRFHYIEQAMYGGLYDNFEGGKGGCEISSRGKSKSYSMAAMIDKYFTLGESEQVKHLVKTLVVANTKEYLDTDGLLNKFETACDFLIQRNELQFPKRRIKNSIKDMEWQMGYYDLNTGTKRGTLNLVIGVATKENIGKTRGKRSLLIIVEEFGCHLKGTEVIMADGSIKKVEDVQIGDFLMGDDGTSRKVLERHSGTDLMYKITLSNGDYQIVNSKHLIYYKRYNWNEGRYKELLQTPEEVMAYKSLDKGNYIIKCDKVRYKHQEAPLHPYWFGLWLGDGDSSDNSVANEDIEVIDWIKQYGKSIGANVDLYFLKQSKKCYNISMRGILDCGKSVILILKEMNVYNNKHVPDIYKYTDKESMLQLIAGLIDTDGNYSQKKRFYEICQKYTRKSILDDVKFMCDSLGFKTTMTTRIGSEKSKSPGTLFYRLRISGDIESIPVKIPRKKAGSPSGYRNRRNWNEYTFKVEPYGIGEYHGFTIDGNHLFVLKDFSIVHNSFGNVLELYNIMKPSWIEGDIAFGTIYMIGTSSEKESDFAGAAEIVYNPKGYRMYGLPNVWDIEGLGRRLITFFFPGYVNYKGYYNKDGVSDVTASIMRILLKRYDVKYNSTDINTITREIAETPITPQEVLTRARNNFFPVAQLNERINQLDSSPDAYDDTYVGDLIVNKDGNMEFFPTQKEPIRVFPLTSDEKYDGALEIYEMPLKNKGGDIQGFRYIIGVDPIDQDYSETVSLYSIFVMDMFTDRIVAEYTGRPMYANEGHEMVRKLCLFYNATACYESNLHGLYSYFQQHKCTHLLCDTPEYLKLKDLIKILGYGNVNKGIRATAPINNYANQLIKDWLMTPMNMTSEVDGVELQITVPQLYTLKNRALLQELVRYNPKINVDRVRAFGMLMLYREQFVITYEGELDRSGSDDSYDASDPANDEFFKKNYHYRGGKENEFWNN